MTHARHSQVAFQGYDTPVQLPDEQAQGIGREEFCTTPTDGAEGGNDMIDILPGYPDDVLAVSGAGRITAEDYRKVLVPEAEARIARNGSLAVLYFLGPKYQAFTSSAVWSDLMFGLSHWSTFGRIALVTDVEWIRASASLFAPFFHGAFRIFGAGDLGAASAWIRAHDGKA